MKTVKIDRTNKEFPIILKEIKDIINYISSNLLGKLKWTNLIYNEKRICLYKHILLIFAFLTRY